MPWCCLTQIGEASVLPIDHIGDAGLLRRYAAIKCASALREAMWSMVQETHSTLDFDYVAYSDENLARFESAYGEFQATG